MRRQSKLVKFGAVAEWVDARKASMPSVHRLRVIPFELVAQLGRASSQNYWAEVQFLPCMRVRVLPVPSISSWKGFDSNGQSQAKKQLQGQQRVFTG